MAHLSEPPWPLWVEKYRVDFYIPLFELRLKISVVVVVIEGHNIVFAVDRYPVHSKSPDAFDVDSDQVSFYVLRQSVSKASSQTIASPSRGTERTQSR